MKLLSFLLCLFLPQLLPAQQFTISAPKMNLVYIGVPNPITVVSGSCGCDVLKVSVDKGELEKTGDCRYNYKPSTDGNVQLTVAEQRGGKLKVIYTGYLRAKRIPAPYAAVGGKKSGYYSLHEFKAQLGVSVLMDNFEMTNSFEVRSFNFIAIRGKSKLIEKQISGARFDDYCRTAIAGLVSGNIIRLERILVGGPDTRAFTVSDLEYTMK